MIWKAGLTVASRRPGYSMLQRSSPLFRPADKTKHFTSDPYAAHSISPHSLWVTDRSSQAECARSKTCSTWSGSPTTTRIYDRRRRARDAQYRGEDFDLKFTLKERLSLQPGPAAQQPGLSYAGRIRASLDPFALLNRRRAERSVSQGFPSARRSGASLTDAPLCSKLLR
jgi:hypothetical protein